MDTTWWAISHVSLTEMLARAHNGESPDLLVAEWYANSDHADVEGD